MRGPKPAWERVIKLADIIENLLLANGRVLSLTEIKAIQAELTEVRDYINGSDYCEID